MSNQGALQGARRRSISESGHPRLNNTSIDDELVFNNIDLSVNRNNLSQQSQPGAGREYHKISWVGMDLVTSKFNKYDLSHICSEYISLSDPNHPVPPLPTYVGGVPRYTCYLE